MKWNHRVVRHRKNGEEWLGIHEVYSSKDDYDKVGGETEDAVPVIGDNLDGLRVTLERMLRCLEKPVLDEDTLVGKPM